MSTINTPEEHPPRPPREPLPTSASGSRTGPIQRLVDASLEQPLLIALLDGISGYWGSYSIPTPDWTVRLPTAAATLKRMASGWPM